MAEEKNVSPAVRQQISETVQVEIDRLALETANLEQQLAAATLEEKKLQLQDLQYKNEETRQRRLAERQKRKNTIEDAKRLAENVRRKQAYCNHTQGGEGLEGLFRGDGLQTTYQLESSVLDEKYFRCIRCGNEVYQDADPKEFRRISQLAHKGLRPPVPVTFKFVNERGETVSVKAVLEAQKQSA